MVQNLKDGQIKKEPLDSGGFLISVSRHHAFGTDAILLADFAAAKKSDIAVDLGTGCGIIPFLFLRDKKTEKLSGVDISSEAIKLCNITNNDLSLSEKFTPICADLKDLKGKLSFGEATLVTCNPPYKAPSAGIKSSDPIECAARHETQCTLADIIDTAYKLMNTSARLCFCHRPERLGELLTLMSNKGIEPKRLRLVCARAGAEPWLVLVEGRKGGKTGLRIEPTLYVEQNGQLSDEMMRIYGPYKTKVDF